MSSHSSTGALIGGHCQLKLLTIYANQFKSNVGIWGKGKTTEYPRKASPDIVENQQTQPTYDDWSGNLT